MDYNHTGARRLGNHSLDSKRSNVHMSGSLSAELQASNRLAAHSRGQIASRLQDGGTNGYASPTAGMRKCASVQSLSTPKPILAMRRVKFKVYSVNKYSP